MFDENKIILSNSCNLMNSQKSNQTKDKMKTATTNKKKKIIKKNEGPITMEDTWSVIDSHFTQYGNKIFIKHQLDSYNDFIINKIDDIITQSNPLIVYHELIEDLNKYKYENSD